MKAVPTISSRAAESLARVPITVAAIAPARPGRRGRTAGRPTDDPPPVDDARSTIAINATMKKGDSR